MKSKLYLETTIPSYLAARQSRDLIIAANQQITREWWEYRRNDFDIYISDMVIEEVAAGDKDVAKIRLQFLEDIPILDAAPEAGELANLLIQSNVIPKKAAQDAIHIALSAVHGMDLLMTWNCKHIANAEIFGAIRNVCHTYGYECPDICTPQELMEK